MPGDDDYVMATIDVVSPLAADRMAAAERTLNKRDLPAALKAICAAEAAGAPRNACCALRWTAFMLAGDFASAWAESDTIRKMGADGAGALWRGESLKGKKVIVRCLHGFGDAVQHLRYAPRLKTIAAHVTYEVSPHFVELARCFKGVDDVVRWGDSAGALELDWDVQVEITELPYIFRTEIDDLPIAQNYLTLPNDSLAQTRQAMGRANGLRVGIVSKAGSWNAARSIPTDCLGPLLDVDGCEFWKLDMEDWNVKGKQSARRIGACTSGLVPLASIIAHLDVVITVDTLAAHLAGALGIPTWLMLQHAADWRWMVDTQFSPWYPSMRLFRQPTPGDWDAVVRDVSGALREMPAARRARASA